MHFNLSILYFLAFFLLYFLLRFSIQQQSLTAYGLKVQYGGTAVYKKKKITILNEQNVET